MSEVYGPQWPTIHDVAAARETTRWLQLTGASEADYRQASLEQRQITSAFISDHAWNQRLAEPGFPQSEPEAGE